MSNDSWQEKDSTTSPTHPIPDCGVNVPELIMSKMNVEGPGLQACVCGALMELLVIGVWMISLSTPFIALGLIWYGGSVAYTTLAGLVAVTVYPYVTPGNEHDGIGTWMAFRYAISEWGQHWHKSCGRIYEVEGPDALESMPPTLLCYHPHGIFTQGYMLNGSLHRELPKILGVLSTALFHAPFFRLVFGKWTGACAPASKKQFLAQMFKGRSLGIVPGGFEEAALTKLGTDRVWIKNRKGFVKYALQYGYRLRPVYTFGETDAFWNPQGAWTLRMWMTSVKIPAVMPVGVWWCPLLPRRVRLMSVFGTPIALPKLPNPSTAEVDKWHGVYVEALIALYDRHKARYASNPEGRLEIW